MKANRLARVAEVVRECASETILFELSDPRVKGVTVTRAEVSGDLQHAKVYVSIMGSAKEQSLCLHGLRHAAGFIQARQLWASAIAQYGEVPEVLHNAARFFEEADPATSAQLARRLQSIDPAGHGKVVEYYFSKVAPAARR